MRQRALRWHTAGFRFSTSLRRPSTDGVAQRRYVIVFNGDLQLPELRDQLKEEAGGCLRLRGHSDTEVLLLAIEHWGLSPL